MFPRYLFVSLVIKFAAVDFWLFLRRDRLIYCHLHSLALNSDAVQSSTLTLTLHIIDCQVVTRGNTEIVISFIILVYIFVLHTY